MKHSPCGSDGKESSCNAGDPSFIPVSGRSPGEGNGNPLQYSYLETSMDRRVWQARVYGVAKSWTGLNDYTFTFHVKCWAGWITSWNQHCWEKKNCWQKYQHQIHNWYRSNGRKWRGIKEPLDEGEKRQRKSCLKTQDSRTKIMASFMANRCGKVETVTDFIVLGPKITADGDCSHEIKRCLLFGRKAMTNL